jgi:hypothetical protein
MVISKLNNALFGGGRNFVWRSAFGVAVPGVLGDHGVPGDSWRVGEAATLTDQSSRSF